MITAVVDTGTLASGFGWSSGPPAQVLDAAVDGRFLLVTSPPLLEELDRVLRYPELARLFPDPGRLVQLVRDVAIVVTPPMALTVTRDPDDNRLFEAAVEARADAIVSGNGDLVQLGTYKGIGICTPRAFIELLARDHPGEPRRARHENLVHIADVLDERRLAAMAAHPSNWRRQSPRTRKR